MSEREIEKLVNELQNLNIQQRQLNARQQQTVERLEQALQRQHAGHKDHKNTKKEKDTDKKIRKGDRVRALTPGRINGRLTAPPSGTVVSVQEDRNYYELSRVNFKPDNAPRTWRLAKNVVKEENQG